MKINIKAYGDYRDGKFAPFSIELERDHLNVTILLTAEQTNDSVEYDKSFQMHPLKDICADSGFTTNQFIEIENGDDSDAHQDFLFKMSGLEEDPFREELAPVEIKSTNPDNPDDGNIQLKSADGIEFTIYTDRDALSPTKTIENLKLVFNQD